MLTTLILIGSISDIVSHVNEDLPPDPTNLEDMIHAALFSGKPASALPHAAQLDPWLAAHLADVMEALSMVEDDIDETYGSIFALNLRVTNFTLKLRTVYPGPIRVFLRGVSSHRSCVMANKC